MYVLLYCTCLLSHDVSPQLKIQASFSTPEPGFEPCRLCFNMYLQPLTMSGKERERPDFLELCRSLLKGKAVLAFQSKTEIHNATIHKGHHPPEQAQANCVDFELR